MGIRARQLEVEINANGANKSANDIKNLDKATEKAAQTLNRYDDELAKLGGHDSELRRLNKWLSQEGVAKSLDETTKALLREQAALLDVQRAAKHQGDTSFFGSVKSNLTSIVAPVSEVIQGVQTVYNWVRSIGGAFIDVANEAVEFGSRIQDLKDQTNLSATTLSTFDFAAAQTNVSIEELTGGFKKFTLEIAAAAQGSEEARKNLLRFGIDPQKAIYNLDGALAQAFRTVYNIKNPILQSQAAFELFGKSGDKVLKLIKSTNGDMGALIEQAKKMGVVLGDEDVAALDLLGDKTALVGKQFQGLSVIVAKELLPTISEWVDGFTHAVESAKPAIESLASQTGATLKKWKDDLNDFYSSYKQFEQHVQNSFPQMKDRSLMDILTGKDKVYKGFQDLGILPSDEQLKNYNTYKKALEDATKLNEDLKKALESGRQLELDQSKQQKVLSQAQLQTLEGEFKAKQNLRSDYLSVVKETLQKEGRLNLDSFKTYTDAAKEAYKLEAQLITQRYQLKAADAKTDAERAQLVKQRQLELDELYRSSLKESTDIGKTIQQAETDRLRAEVTTRLTIEKHRSELKETALQNELDLLQKQKEAGLNVEQEIASKEVEINKTKYENRRYELLKSLKNELLLINQNAEARQLVENTSLGDIEKFARDTYQNLYNTFSENPSKVLSNALATLSSLLKELTLHANNAEKSLADLAKIPLTAPPPPAPDSQEGNVVLTDEQAGTPPKWHSNNTTSFFEGMGGDIQSIIGQMGVFESVFDKATGKITSLTFNMSNAFKVLGQTVMDVVGGIARGVGTMVENWVLYGETGPDALRKVTAQVLASVAAQAAVQAIMCTAYGVAALTPWGAALFGPAAAWFKAAALFASVAAIAGAAGRAVAGDSFSQQSGSGTGESSSSGQSQSSGNEITRNRTASVNTLGPSYYSNSAQANAGNANSDSPARAEFDAKVDQFIEKLSHIFSGLRGVRPGDILQQGINQRPGLVTNTIDRELGSRQGTAKSINRKLGHGR